MNTNSIKLIKRGDSNFELYQDGFLIASTFNTDFPTILFSENAFKEWDKKLDIVDVESKLRVLGKGKFSEQLFVDYALIGYKLALSDNQDKIFTLDDVVDIVEKMWGEDERIKDWFKSKMSTKDAIQKLTNTEQTKWDYLLDNQKLSESFFKEKEYSCQVEIDSFNNYIKITKIWNE